MHLGKDGAGFWRDGHLVRAPAAAATRQVNATGTGDLLSAVMIAMHRATHIPIDIRLAYANRLVADYISGTGPMAASITNHLLMEDPS